MADFNSNFNDLQRQIAVADLTDEQIQELVTALQTRRSVRPELTKEERVFLQCCREHRSIATIKIWILLSALIVALLSLSRTAQEMEDRDTSAKVVKRHSVIPLVQLPWVVLLWLGRKAQTSKIQFAELDTDPWGQG